jgi:hypothetical protein
LKYYLLFESTKLDAVPKKYLFKLIPLSIKNPKIIRSLYHSVVAEAKLEQVNTELGNSFKTIIDRAVKDELISI